eukprot:8779485-Pyramimonas_sp.AAC.1
MPEPPAYLPRADARRHDVCLWGDAHGVWGLVSYTDGSGCDSGVPEVRRCGQAFVQFDLYSWPPVRARIGPLPYLAQTGGRAERHAIREGLDAFPDHQCF